MALDWRNSVEYRWNKSGHIRGDAMKPFHRSGMAAGGANRSACGRKRPFLAVLDPFGGPLAHPDGPPWPPKLFQFITGDVP